MWRGGGGTFVTSLVWWWCWWHVVEKWFLKYCSETKAIWYGIMMTPPPWLPNNMMMNRISSLVLLLTYYYYAAILLQVEQLQAVSIDSRFGVWCGWNLALRFSIFSQNRTPLLSPYKIARARAMAVRLLTTAVVLPRGRQPNTIDCNTIPIPLAAIPAHFDRCRLLHCVKMPSSLKRGWFIDSKILTIRDIKGRRAILIME